MRKALIKFGVGLVFVLIFKSSQAKAAVINVPSQYPTIQSAISISSNGDTILVDDGTYTENINFSGKAITIKSVNGATNAIIDGSANGNVVTFNSGEGANSMLDGFTIRNGSATHGGGILCYLNSSPTINNCIIQNNFGQDSAGGIACYDNASPIITNCIISDNEAVGGGGGIWCYWYASPTIISCTINNNSAYYGGGVYSDISSLATFTNCILNNNMANYGGGILCNRSSSLTITNCTITSNIASNDGGGIHCASSSPTVKNSIFWGDTADVSGNEIYLDGSSTIDITYSNIQGGWAGANNIDADPRFVGNYRLSVGSPCIDKGISVGAPPNDIDGDTRPQFSGYDIGADEYSYGKIYYQDLDGDGYGDPAMSIQAYPAPEDCYVSDNSDCDDTDTNINPEISESGKKKCNDGIDNDCNGLIDCSDPGCATTKWCK